MKAILWLDSYKDIITYPYDPAFDKPIEIRGRPSGYISIGVGNQVISRLSRLLKDSDMPYYQILDKATRHVQVYWFPEVLVKTVKAKIREEEEEEEEQPGTVYRNKI